MKKGKIAGGRPPLGYELVDNQLVKIDFEAEIVNDIFKMRSKGMSLSAIGDKYNFSKQRVDYILKNKIYLGEYNNNGKKEKNDINKNEKTRIYKQEQFLNKY